MRTVATFTVVGLLIGVAAGHRVAAVSLAAAGASMTSQLQTGATKVSCKRSLTLGIVTMLMR
jgi:hypothetical protein